MNKWRLGKLTVSVSWPRSVMRVTMSPEFAFEAA
jgi:hypothetical protein